MSEMNIKCMTFHPDSEEWGHDQEIPISNPDDMPFSARVFTQQKTMNPNELNPIDPNHVTLNLLQDTQQTVMLVRQRLLREQSEFSKAATNYNATLRERNRRIEEGTKQNVQLIEEIKSLAKNHDKVRDVMYAITKTRGLASQLAIDVLGEIGALPK
jgi:septal ring factor EnvC (AmiA/AmiB activator)